MRRDYFQQEAVYQSSVPFIGEPTLAGYLQLEKMDSTTFERMTGFDLFKLASTLGP